MFDFGAKVQVLRVAWADCAVAGYAVCNEGLVEDWNALTECVDMKPVTMKCARAGIAIANYARASWRICPCTETQWAEQNQYNIMMPHHNCEES